jgi:hypothetical protein
VAADVYSTCRVIGPTSVETSPVFAGNRSCKASAGIGLAAFGAYTALHAVEWHVGHEDSSKVIRALTPWMVPAAVAPIHITAAVHNFRLESK